jgi:hypothetical protein
MATKIITPHGNVKISTSVKKFGVSSGYFDGSGDYLETPDSDDYAFGSGDFTLEAWIQFVSYSSSGRYTIIGSTGSGHWFTFEVLSGRLSFSCDSIVNISTYAQTWNNGQWYHVAVVKNGSSIVLYRDGSDLSIDMSFWYTGYTGAAFPNVSAPLRIGTLSGSDRFMRGYMDEVRISKGVARWTSAFTPATQPYGTDLYTVLLLHCDGENDSTTFIDSSAITYKSSGHVIFGPFLLPEVDDFSTSQINWSTVLPDDTSILVYSGLADSEEVPDVWEECVNGGEIPTLIAGRDLYIKVDLETSDTSVTPELDDLSFTYKGDEDKTKVRIKLTEPGRLKHPQGNVTVAYTASSGNLKNAAGTLAVATFEQAFDPDEEDLTLFFNPHDPENVEISGVGLTVDVNKVTYVDGKDDENIEIDSLDMTIAVYDTEENPV